MAGIFDRKFTPEQAAQLVAWQQRQPAPAADEDSPLSEFDRLIGIMGEHTAGLDAATKRRLALAWGVTYRLAWLTAEDTSRKHWAEHHAERVAAMDGALNKLLDALEDVSEAWGDVQPSHDGPNSEHWPAA